MNTISRTVSGAAALTLGLAVIGAALVEQPHIYTMLWALGWGGVVSGLGVYLLFNTKEDEIEEITNNDEEK